VTCQFNDATLGNWVKADAAERGVPDKSGLLPLTAAERAELTQLRRDNTKLKVEREILAGVRWEGGGSSWQRLVWGAAPHRVDAVPVVYDQRCPTPARTTLGLVG